MISITASRGKVHQLHLVKEISSPTGERYAQSSPETIREFHLSDATWDFLAQALTSVVDNGTGQACKISGIKVAGKTGTAQNPHGKDHAWFVAYAPVDNPQIAVAVVVEHGEKGSVSAAPLAKKVILAALSRTMPELELADKKTQAISSKTEGD
jgi:penicillin-binding protein 2